jgi:hypothetical protein
MLLGSLQLFITTCSTAEPIDQLEQLGVRLLTFCGKGQGVDAKPVCFTGSADVGSSIDASRSEQSQQKLRDEFLRRAEEARSRLRLRSDESSKE